MDRPLAAGADLLVDSCGDPSSRCQFSGAEVEGSGVRKRPGEGSSLALNHLLQAHCTSELSLLFSSSTFLKHMLNNSASDLWT